MARNIYALLVGIDDYPEPVYRLSGCVNDVMRLCNLLQIRITSSNDRFMPLLLTNTKATRQGIIAAWREHLGQARPGDVALFYYSGHGSQEHAPIEFWDLEPDRMNETLVCYDSRLSDGRDLADKELAQLTAEVAANKPHITLILDCCHSGSGSRDSNDVAIRQVTAHPDIRPIESYIVQPEQIAVLQGRAPSTAALAMPWIAIASGRHITLAACRPQETAKEMTFWDEQGVTKRGVFSYYLEDTLRYAEPTLSYRDIFSRVSALVRGRVADQTPQLESSDPADLGQPFLGGAIQTGPIVFTLSADKSHRWLINGGAVHGIAPVSDGETTHLAVFPFDTPAENFRSRRHAIGEALIQQVLPGESSVIVTRFDGTDLDPKMTYKARVTGLPLPPLAVSCEGDAAALALVYQALAVAGIDCGPSLLVKAKEEGWAEYRLLADVEADSFRITRAATAWSLAVDTPGLDKDSAVLVVERLEHIARWVRVLNLRNRSQIPPDAIRLEVFRERDGKTLELLDARNGVQLMYEKTDGVWRWPRIRIKLTNTGTQPYYAMLMNLTGSYAIFTGLLPDFAEPLHSGEERWAQVQAGLKWRKTIDATVSQSDWRQGITDLHDTLKLIVSTVAMDVRLLQQGNLPVTTARVVHRDVPVLSNTLGRLMARVFNRDMGAEPRADDEIADWVTSEVSLTIVRPREAATTL